MSATPNAGGSASRRSVTASGTKSPSTETAFTVSSGPWISSSTRMPPPRDSAAASATAVPRPAASWTSVRPRCPCRSAALTTQGNGIAGSPGEKTRGCGTPAAASRSRWRVFVVASTAVAPSIGCGRPSRSAMRAAIPTGQSAPGETTPSTLRARARRSMPGSSSEEMIARSVACANPGALGSRSATITVRPRAEAASSSPSWAAPAPRTRRRAGSDRGRLATRPRSRGTRRPSARARRRMPFVPASP